MSSGSEIPVTWKDAFSRYETVVHQFAEARQVAVDTWYHNAPVWCIGKPQEARDLDCIVWSIHLIYSAGRRIFRLDLAAWMDTEYFVLEGLVHKRKQLHRDARQIFAWRSGDNLDLGVRLEEAYQKAMSVTENDLTDVSVSVEGADQVRRPYTEK